MAIARAILRPARHLALTLMLSSTALAPTAHAAASQTTGGTSANQPAPAVTHYRTTTIEGISVFYREAGPADAPVVLLLHGFPTSSHMFRNLIPILAERYHVIAPDYRASVTAPRPTTRRSPIRSHTTPPSWTRL